jgi:LmbE family N-acetylglucosaminyl deacetylase
MKLRFDVADTGALKVLCLGCHSDDIEIGCGGTILRLAAEYPACQVDWVVFSAIGEREREAQLGAQRFAGPRLRNTRLEQFSDAFMPYVGADVKAVFESLKSTAPDVILTHFRHDAHQDHRLISELTWNTFRDHLILEYEIPKYDGDLGQPNLYVPLDEAVLKEKVRHLMDVFQSQRSRRWFQEDTFFALARLRGMECNSPSGYAEAFYSRKVSL